MSGPVRDLPQLPLYPGTLAFDLQNIPIAKYKCPREGCSSVFDVHSVLVSRMNRVLRRPPFADTSQIHCRNQSHFLWHSRLRPSRIWPLNTRDDVKRRTLELSAKATDVTKEAYNGLEADDTCGICYALQETVILCHCFAIPITLQSTDFLQTVPVVRASDRTRLMV